MAAVTELSEGPASDFPDEWYEVAGEGLFWFEWRFRAFLSQLDALGISRDNRWHGLDIGCGHGVVRHQIEAASTWTTDGADLNRDALAQNHTRQGETFYYDVHDRRAELAGHYDFLILFDVLEHLERTTEFLESALHHLRPGGLLFVNVPAIDSLRSRYDEVVGHLRRYSKTSLGKQAAAVGLEVRDLRYWGLSMLPYLALRKLMVPRRAGAREAIQRGVVPPAAWTERPILAIMKLETRYLRRPLLGASLLMVAAKPRSGGLRPAVAYFSTRQKIRLARSLATKTSPAYVQFYITARCNLACEQCNIIYADGDSSEMNIHQIRKMAENFADIGVCMVLLIGGEPFARSDLPEIIEAFVKNDIHVRMQTNGLASRQMLQRCVDAGGHDISISLDSLEGPLQDRINGGFRESWQRAIRAIADVNQIFPENGTAFFGTVLMPRNLEHVADVMEFATEIGWGVSLVPAHVSTPDRPRGFRTFDDGGACRFPESMYPRLREVLDELKILRDGGMSLYDSDEYLEDIYRFLTHEPVQWRRRNRGVCDSPQLYFAVEPNGNINPCCDFKLGRSHPVFQPEFPALYRSGRIHREVYEITRRCDGCMYGSYPEISITARFLRPLLERARFFNLETQGLLKKLGEAEMLELAREIHSRGENRRARLATTASGEALPA